MNALTREEKLENIYKLVDNHQISAYSIAKNTGLSESGIGKILNKRNTKPHNTTVNLIYEYVNNYVKQLIQPKETPLEVKETNQSEYQINHKNPSNYSDLPPEHIEALKNKFQGMLVSINDIIKNIEVLPASVNQINQLKEAEIARADILQFLEGLNR